MEYVRISVGAATDAYPVIRSAHNREIIRRVTVSFDKSFTISTSALDLWVDQYRNGSYVTMIAGALSFNNGVAINPHQIYEMPQQPTEGQFVMLQEQDTVIVHVNQGTGSPLASFNAIIGLS